MPTQFSETEYISAERSALVDALYHIPENGKAEIIGGKIVRMRPTGARPGRVAGKIFFSLAQPEEGLSLRRENLGYAFSDNVGFLVHLPNPDSFSPDAAWYTGPLGGSEMDFLSEAPAFAVEVRSKNDYGPKAEREITEKIEDYFAAGTLVVWDVDTLGLDVVRVFRRANLDAPTIYRRGDVAEAEPAVPGWTMAVDALFQRPLLPHRA